MTTPSAVAKAIARDAEARARTALGDVTAAHAELRNAEAAITAARDRHAAAGPALARAIDAALAAGITTQQLADLGIPVPAPCTRRPRTHRQAAPDPGSRTPAGVTADQAAGIVEVPDWSASPAPTTHTWA